MGRYPRSSLQLFRFSEEHEPYWAGQVIFEEGQPGKCMYVVKEGTVELQVGGKTVETVDPGGILGELALIDSGTRSAKAIAKTDCKLVSINEERFKYLIQQTPYFAIEVMRIMAKRIRRGNSQNP